jgi:hypothetical protein
LWGSKLGGNVLSKQQIWQIVAYLRAGFPAVGPAPAGH